MSLKRIIEKAPNYDIIFITGGQRSGTQIAAKIIAHETGRQFIHEKEFDVHYIDKMWECVYNAEKPVVVHAPALFHHLPELQDDYILKVCVMRDIDKVKASIKRIDWKEDNVERAKIEGVWNAYPENITSVEAKNMIFTLKYFHLKHHDVVHYKELMGHKLFVNNRKNWEAWRTE